MTKEDIIMINYEVSHSNLSEEEYTFENEVSYYDEGYDECRRCGNKDCLDNQKLCSHCSEVWG